MKKTKAIITVGPSSTDINVLRELIKNGADVIRINLSHADRPFCDDIIKKVRKLENEFDRAIGIMLDTDGPSVRLDEFKEKSVTVEENRKINDCPGAAYDVKNNIDQFADFLPAKNRHNRRNAEYSN